MLNDLNGDGWLDAVTSNYFGSSLSVFFNQGKSGFAAAVTLAADALPTFLAAGDLTGDGHSEIVVSHLDDHVTILVNQGNGSFLPALSEPVGTTPYGVTVGDTPWEQYPPLFASLDGNRTFNSTGTVLYAAPGRYRDMKPETTLQAPFYGFGYRYIADDLANRRTYAIQGGNTYQGGLLANFVEPEQWIAVYAEADLAYQGMIPVPCRREANHPWDAYGRFVFASAAGDRIYVITTTNDEAALANRWGLGVYDALGHPLPAAGP